MNRTLILIFLNIYSVNSVQCKDIPPKFTGVFKYETKGIPDSISISTLKEANSWGKLTTFYVKVNSDKRFYFELPKISEPTLFYIGIRSSGKTTLKWAYYAEPNDDVGFKIFEKPVRDSLFFEGAGADKYNLTEKLMRQFNGFKNLRKKLKAPADSAGLNLYLKQLSVLVKQYSEEKLNTINSYTELEGDIKSLLKYQFASYYGIWTSLLDYFYRYDKNHANARSRNQVSKYFNLYDRQFSYSPDSISVLSPAYFIGLAFRLKTGLLINSKSGNVDFKTYYDALKNSQTGIIKERLLTEFFISSYTTQNTTGYDPDVFDSLVMDAYGSVKYPYYKELIAEKTKTKKGSKIYEGKFLDLNGKSFNIKSLKGKVVLIDVWAVGCGGCAEFHSIFENKIYPSFKNDNDFVVLSICADQTRKRWLEGLNTGKYSSKHYLNVSTGKLGQKHPFFEYYTNSLPLLLLVDKEGRIVTKIRGAESPMDLINLIRYALDKTDSNN